MKKLFFVFTVLLSSAVLMPACDDKDDPIPQPVTGYTFTAVTSPSTQTLNDVEFVKNQSQVGFIAAGDGVLKTTDGGSSWTKLNSTGVFTIAPVTESIIYAGGFNGVLIKSTNGGTSWTNLTPPVGTANNHVWSMYFSDANTGYISQGADAGKIYKTTDGGNTWTTISFSGGGAPVLAIQFPTSQTGFVVTGDPGTLFKTANGGAAWTSPITGVANGLTSIFFLNENTGWVGDHNGAIRKTSNGGTSFTSQTTGVTAPIRALHFVNENLGFAVGDNGTVLSTKDGGQTWKKETVTAATGFVQGVYLVNENLGFIVGEGGKIVKLAK